MRVLRQLEELSTLRGPTVASIGNFDGVHIGHQHVLQQVVARAKEYSGQSLAVTFEPHPTRVLRPDRAPKLITQLEDKLDLIAAQGIDATLVVPFSSDFAATSAESFCRQLVNDAKLVEVHEGANFRFGRNAEADIARMQELGAALGFCVTVFPVEHLRRETVSSSCIRRVLAEGRINLARHLLGRCFSIRSTPARGRGYGSRYAVPTINLAPYPELLPANGVYVTHLEIGGRTWRSVTNIGNRPTFGADSFAVETHILDFEPIDLDESTPLRLTFLHRLREERKWPTPEALRAQIGIDVRRAQRWFALTG